MPKNNKADERCCHTTADGRRCRMPAMPGHDSLCLPHWQRQHQEHEAEAVATELLGPFKEFETATAVNHALGKLFCLLARGRVPARNAAVLAYIGQLLLNSLASVQREAQLARGYDKWHGLLRRTLRDAQRDGTLAALERAAARSPLEVEVLTHGATLAAGSSR